jgi:hypothetical protein
VVVPWGALISSVLEVIQKTPDDKIAEVEAKTSF